MALKPSSARFLLACSAIGLSSALHVPSHAAVAPSLAHRAPQHNLRLVPDFKTKQDKTMRLRGGSSPTSLVFSLFKAIVGSGVLCLSGGMGSATDDPKMLGAAVLLAAFMASLSGYSYVNIGKLCQETKAVSYKGLWEKTVSPSTAWIPSVIIVSQTAVATISYAIITGDILRDIAAACKVTGTFGERNVLLALAATFVFMPLCLLRDFKKLAVTSMFGVAGVLYCVLFMSYRYFQGAYAKGGALLKSLEAIQKPQFGSSFKHLKSLILVSMFNTAFLAHYDAPKFLALVNYNILDFENLVSRAFTAAFIVASLIMGMGFMTFGGGSLGLILNNYAKSDGLALLARAGMLASILFGYPLVFSGFRTGLLAMMDIHEPSQKLQDMLAVGTVVASVGIGMVMTNLGFAASLSGALFGSCLIYVFPALMYTSHTRNLVEADKKNAPKKKWGSKEAPKVHEYTNEYYLNLGIAALGVGLAGVGATVSILQSFTDVLN